MFKHIFKFDFSIIHLCFMYFGIPVAIIPFVPMIKYVILK